MLTKKEKLLTANCVLILVNCLNKNFFEQKWQTLLHFTINFRKSYRYLQRTLKLFAKMACCSSELSFTLFYLDSSIQNARKAIRLVYPHLFCKFRSLSNHAKKWRTHKHILINSFIHLAVCLTIGPKLLPKRNLHIVRSRASPFRCDYPLLSLKSSSSFLRLPPRLPDSSISPFIFSSITFRRRQFLRKIWPI
jgi:hypothetical protein